MKCNLINAEDIKDIYDNPIVQTFISILSKFPGFKDGVDAAIEKALTEFQHRKRKELFEIILEDNTITMDDVNDVTVLMEFAKVLDVVNRLARNGKVKYFARLLRSSIKEIRAGKIDEFEERLAGLSEREIDLLELLYRCEENCKANENRFNASKSWKSFVDETNVRYGFNETDVASAMMAIARSGFCMSEWSAGLNNGDTRVMYKSSLSENGYQKQCCYEQQHSVNLS